jgi:hypothetical protein
MKLLPDMPVKEYYKEADIREVFDALREKFASPAMPKQLEEPPKAVKETRAETAPKVETAFNVAKFDEDVKNILSGIELSGSSKVDNERAVSLTSLDTLVRYLSGAYSEALGQPANAPKKLITMVSFTKGYFVAGMPAGYNYVKNALQNEISRYKRELAANPSTARLPVIVSPAIINALVASVEKKAEELTNAFKTSKYYGIYPPRASFPASTMPPFTPPDSAAPSAPSTPISHTTGTPSRSSQKRSGKQKKTRKR